MIVSFTGAQSTGKTTLLNILKAKNDDVHFVDEVTRRIKREYNLPINEEGGILTQSMIMSDHIANVYRKYDDDNLVVLDRCAIDGVVYTNWLFDNTDNISSAMFHMATEIYKAIRNEYDVIFYTDPNDVELEDDGERSSDKKFRDDIIKLFNDTIKQHNNIVVLCGTVEERLETIKKTLEKFKIDINI